MATFDDADRVASALVDRLAEQWLVGVGVVADGAGFAVSVRITEEAPDPGLPPEIDGVPIRVVRRATPRAT